MGQHGNIKTACSVHKKGDCVHLSDCKCHQTPNNLPVCDEESFRSVEEGHQRVFCLMSTKISCEVDKIRAPMASGETIAKCRRTALALLRYFLAVFRSARGPKNVCYKAR